MADSPFGRDVSDVLVRHQNLFRKGRALDIGCANGATTRWLKDLGFDATGLDVRLPEGADPNLFIAADIRGYEMPEVDLVVALNVLQFLKPSEKSGVLAKINRALKPGALVFIESFTTDDPGFRECQSLGLKEIEPNAFFSPRRNGVTSFFMPGELRSWASANEIETVAYSEEIIEDEHPPLGKHTHGLVTAIFRKPG